MNNKKTDYSMARNIKKKKRIHPVSIIRALIQLISFVVLPGLFIIILSSTGTICSSIIKGTFNIAEQAWQIVLVSITFIFTFIWGRFFCGFICSFGAMQDLLWLGGKHLPKKIKVSEKADKYLKLLKYGVLLFVIFGVWIFSVTGTTLWSPWTIFGIYAAFKGFPSAGYLVSIGGVLLLAIILGSFFIERFFCKYLCPLGAIFSLISRFRIFRIKKPSAGCGSCRLCSSKCSMSIPMNKYDSINSGECIDCMRCTTVCHRNNIKADIVPAVSGTVAAAALIGVYYVGNISSSKNDSSAFTSEISENAVTGQFKDGTYSGTGSGFRGDISLSVTVSGGNITSITVESYKDDNEFFSKAKNSVIPGIISSQSTDVDTVSGATFSSSGIIEAVKNALEGQLANSESSSALQQSDSEISQGESSTSNGYNKHGGKKRHSRDNAEASLDASADSSVPEEDSTAEEPSDTEESTTQESLQSKSSTALQASFADGVYSGTGTGYRGATNVSVTVSGGRITDITVTSYKDDGQFFNRASSGIISSVIQKQATDVDTVSGATFSSNGLLEAISDALGIEFSNPNSSMSRRGHGR